MDERTWSAAILRLFEFYRVDKLPTQSQQDLWFESTKHIGNAEVDAIITGITGDCDSLPRNIPKVFIGHRPSPATPGRLVHYDPVEDYRFPVGLLQAGLRILEDKGEAAFVKYADQVAMPANDRERVRCKLRVYRESELGKEIRTLGLNIEASAISGKTVTARKTA